jgi:hypothetical protein
MKPERSVCVACRREIDPEARICPFCGANPRSGEHVDTKALLQREFTKKKELAPHQTALEFVRHRQSLVVAAVIAGVFVLLFGLHRLVTYWNQNNVSPAPPQPLTEVADVAGQGQQPQELPIPDLKFAYDGNPKAVHTFLVEPGAVAPTPPAQAGVTAPKSVSGRAAP